MNGYPLEDTAQDIPERQQAIEALHRNVFGEQPHEALPDHTQALRNGHTPTLSDEDLIRRAFSAENGPKVRALGSGDNIGYASASEADLAYASALAFWARGDTAQVERLMWQSARVRDKWRDHSTYLRDTVHKACTGRSEYFNPNRKRSANGHTREAVPPDKAPTVANAIVELPDRIQPVDGGEPCTELGNSERLIRYFGDRLRYSEATDWLVWNGQRWIASPALVVALAKRVTRAVYGEASAAADEGRRKELADHAKRSERRATIDAMIALAKSDPAIRISKIDDLDADPLLLNCLNWTINLRTGEPQAHKREDLITRLAPVEYDTRATAPTWERVLRDVFADNEELIAFFQRLIGYTMTGLTIEQCMTILFGGGANGKTTVTAVLIAILGDYALQTPPETFLAKRGGNIPNDVARLRGARLVLVQEVAENKYLDEALVKQATGGDRLAARFLHQEWFDFLPTFKLLMATNHKPGIKGTDYAIWRRINLLPFDVTFPPAQQDKKLRERLLAEAPGILRWAVEGCLEWQREGLNPPPQVLAATGEYKTEMDMLSGFLEDCCLLGPDYSATWGTLYATYKAWCTANNEEPASSKDFGERLKEKGCNAIKGTGGTRRRANIGLREDLPEDVTRQLARTDRQGELKWR